MCPVFGVLTKEFATAPKHRAFILTLHLRSIRSTFFTGTRRWPTRPRMPFAIPGACPTWFCPATSTITSGWMKTISPASPTPFIVSGNGGCHNLHPIHSANGDVATDTRAKLVYGKVVWGYLTLTIDKHTISGHSTEIDRTGKVSPGDSFSYPAGPIVLADPKSVPTLQPGFRAFVRAPGIGVKRKNCREDRATKENAAA